MSKILVFVPNRNLEPDFAAVVGAAVAQQHEISDGNVQLFGSQLFTNVPSKVIAFDIGDEPLTAAQERIITPISTALAMQFNRIEGNLGRFQPYAGKVNELMGANGAVYAIYPC